METILLTSIGILCFVFAILIFQHVSKHEKIDATRVKRIYKRKKNKK